MNIENPSDLIESLLSRHPDELSVRLRPEVSRLRSLRGSRERLETRLAVLSGVADRMEEINGELERLDGQLTRILKAMSGESDGLALLCVRAAIDGFIEAGPDLGNLVSIWRENSVSETLPGNSPEEADETEIPGLFGATLDTAWRMVRSGSMLVKGCGFERAAREFERRLRENPWGDGRYSCPLTAGRLEVLSELSADLSVIEKRISDLISARDSFCAGLGWSSATDPDWLEKATVSCEEDIAEVDRQTLALDAEILKTADDDGECMTRGVKKGAPGRDDPKRTRMGDGDRKNGGREDTGRGGRFPGWSRLDDPVFVETLPERGHLMPDHYRFPREESCLSTAEMAMFSRDSIVAYYRNVTEKLSLPDRASMIRSSVTQVPILHETIRRVSGLLGIDPPEVYLCFENDRYGAACEGLDKPWIIFYTENFDDLTNQEICFLIARELAHIHCGHLFYRIVADGLVDAAGYLDRIPGLSMALSLMGPLKVKQVLGMVLNPWRRAAEHTADLAGFLATGGDIKACCRAIMKENLRTRKLMSLTSVGEYYSQVRSLDGMTGFMANLGKLDESRPYGQYRIREIVRYASGGRGKKALRLVSAWDTNVNGILDRAGNQV